MPPRGHAYEHTEDSQDQPDDRADTRQSDDDARDNPDDADDETDRAPDVVPEVGDLELESIGDVDQRLTDIVGGLAHVIQRLLHLADALGVGVAGLTGPRGGLVA